MVRERHTRVSEEPGGEKREDRSGESKIGNRFSSSFPFFFQSNCTRAQHSSHESDRTARLAEERDDSGKSAQRDWARGATT